MDRQAIDVHGRIAFSNANCALPQDGSKAPMAEGPVLADTVAKVENRSALKISQKWIFGRLCRCVAFQRH